VACREVTSSTIQLTTRELEKYFKQFDFGVTFAGVGMLFSKNAVAW
jgi:hypothetical protein